MASAGFKFSNSSKKRLAECHPDLVKVMNEAIRYYDFTVLCGHRGQQEQDIAYAKGLSKLQYPQGKHNKIPSLAVDIAPYPIDWSNHARFYELKEVVFQCAGELGIKLRWGGDWDMDGDSKDEKFLDLPHYEVL